MQINSVIATGSTGRIARDLYDVLIQKDHECLIAYGRGVDASNYHSYRIGNKIDNYTHYLRSYLLNQNGLGSLRATKELIKKIIEFNPDLIHLHNIHGYYSNFPMLFSFLAEYGRPVIWLLHDQWAISGGPAFYEPSVDHDEEFSQFSSKEDYPKALTRKNYKNILHLKEKHFNSLDNLTIVTPSHWLGELVKKSFLNKNHILTIHNGIDMTTFRPTRSNLRDTYNLNDKFIVLSVASEWDERKGMEYLSRLANQLPDNYQLVVIGEIQNQEVQLPEQVIKIEKTQNVTELVEWYSVADVLANPTLFDNFPSVNIEALACGTPVITFDSGGSGEAADSRSGRVVERGNEEAFLNALLEQAPKNETFIESCINRASQFEKNIQYDKYIHLYESLF